MPSFIDLPASELSTETLLIAGWVAGADPSVKIGLFVNAKAVPFTRYERPDVEGAFPDCPFVTGVTALCDLNDLASADRVEISLRHGGEAQTKTCTVPLGLRANMRRMADIAAESRRYCEAYMRCPACGAPRKSLVSNARSITCNACRVQFKQDGRALNFISSGLGQMAGAVPTRNVSANPYTPETLELIDHAVAAGGWVLDCGAGQRDQRRSHVINLEIVDYRSTDVLAVGEALPFEDGCFDAVLSLAVLEHVRDPFKCARELARVLKPGGALIADVPFLQPVHGYPNHYYNMTEQGLRNLFAGLLEVDSCHVPAHGHPIFGIAWTLNGYRAGLPEPQQLAFDRLTVGELTTLDIHSFLTMPLAQISPEARQVTACLNTIRAHKSG